MSTLAHYQHAPAATAPALRNTYTVQQFAAEILCGHLSAEWVRDQIAARKIKALTKRPILISQGEAMRFLGR
jgi:hypothetical protein